MQRRKCCSLLGVALIAAEFVLAEPIPVRYPEGSVHGFLALRTLQGKILASGDLTQVVHKNRTIAHLVYRFRDGSVDDDTAIFSQQGAFRLISDHHIQRGPTFPNPTDVLIDASAGKVTVKYEEKGEKKILSESMDLPPDVSNGIILNVIKNISPATEETKLSYVAATPKPRLVHLSISPQGKEAFSVASARYKSTRYVVKVNLGGLGGVIAPMLGKQPEDTYVWVAGGEAPAFVKSKGPFYLSGPILTTEMTSPVWRTNQERDQ